MKPQIILGAAHAKDDHRAMMIGIFRKLRERLWDKLPFQRRGGLFRGYHVAALIIAGIIGVQIIGAYFVGSAKFGIRWSDVFGLISDRRAIPGWVILPLFLIASATVSITRRKIDRPAATLLRWLRYRSDWLVRGSIIILAYPTMSNSFSILKSAIPFIVPFYADAHLIKIDKILCLGHDCWDLTHRILPYNLIYVLDRMYIVWFTYLALVTGIFSFTRNVRFQMISATAFFMCWLLLGNLLATALSSVGPVFFDVTFHQNHFRGLLEVLDGASADRGLIAIKTIHFLEERVGTVALGAGISAMPSMHVSIAFLGFLMALQLKSILLKFCTFAFTCIILVASVHLGWHYFSDGLVSLALTAAIWALSVRIVDWSYREPVLR